MKQESKQAINRFDSTLSIWYVRTSINNYTGLVTTYVSTAHLTF